MIQGYGGITMRHRNSFEDAKSQVKIITQNHNILYDHTYDAR